MAGRRTTEAGNDPWLSIGAASRRLGVGPDTLRRWADAGRVETFVTPGGHRRFSAAGLAAIADRPPAVKTPYVGLGDARRRLAAAYRRQYQGQPPSVTAAVPIDTAERLAFRATGRALVEAVVRYVDGADGVRGAAEVDARRATLELAIGSRRLGIALPTAIELFLAARQPLFTEIAGIGRRRSLTSAEVSDLYHRSSALFDRQLVVFVATRIEGDHPA